MIKTLVFSLDLSKNSEQIYCQNNISFIMFQIKIYLFTAEYEGR